jgi:hypothetical protein
MTEKEKLQKAIVEVLKWSDGAIVTFNRLRELYPRCNCPVCTAIDLCKADQQYKIDYDNRWVVFKKRKS